MHPSVDPPSDESDDAYADARPGAMDNWEEMLRGGGSHETFAKKVRFFDVESCAFPLTYEQALKGM